MIHPHAPAELLREGYCVDFTSRYTGFVCFQSITGARDGILRSTVRGIEIAFWPGRDEALAWVEAMGYRPGAPVPVGAGHMRICLRPFAHHLVDPEWCRGTLFEVPASLAPGVPAEPAPVVEAPPPATRPYRPSNATDGDGFEAQWCSRCTKDRGPGRICGILTRAMAHEIEHPKYPPEWVRTDEHPWGTCTAFVEHAVTPPKPRNRIRPAREQASLF